MDPDLNKYDVEHVCTAHPRMRREEWEAIYRESWSLYYTPGHMETLLRRAVATGVSVHGPARTGASVAGGVLRLKHPSERRPGLPRERALIFWPRFVWETLGKHMVIIAMIARLFLLKLVIARDPAARTYTAVALTPVNDEEDETLDLFTQTTGASAAIAHVKKIAELTGAGRVRRSNEYAEFG
jgi:hypothetical protein